MSPEQPGVLVVDDDEAVRHWACAALKTAGYAVREAANGESALAVLRNSPEAIRIIITDIAMPGMDGLELARRAWELDARTRVIYMTGFVDRAIEAGACVLFKPFTFQALKNAVAHAWQSRQ